MKVFDKSVSHFNDVLEAGEVVVGMNDTYTDNNGHEIFVYVWNGSTCVEVKCISGYTPYVSYDIDANYQQIAEAGVWWAHNERKSGGISFKNVFEGVVILKRSRKAKNGVPLNVIDWTDSYVDNFGHTVPPSIVVHNLDDDDKSRVSLNCVNEIVRTDYPLWAKKFIIK